MQTLLRILDLLFGCHHRDLSRVFTLNGRTYRVCCTCGTRFSYSLAGMRMGPRLAEVPLENFYIARRNETLEAGLDLVKDF